MPFSFRFPANGRPWTTAKETAEALQKTETGYILSGDMTERLSGENAWAIYIDNDTLEVKWHTENLPDTVPLHYTISDIASLTRGYIDEIIIPTRRHMFPISVFRIADNDQSIFAFSRIGRVSIDISYPAI